ncbi:MAG TPA: tryptophan halogenase family protein [Cellvibrio sp.]|nr:tryptophan halogenase family protein [Cellvibrio sp.]
MQKNINKIVIVGGGTAGWMTAAALSKTLGCHNYQITVIESEQVGTVGVGEATIPPIFLFNGVLGLDEDEFIRETNATFKLGIEFVNWRKKGHSYFHPFGVIGADYDGVAFTNFWMRWRKEGGNADYTKFNIETQAAFVHKFSRSGMESNPISMPRVNYAFHFDAGLYANYLRRYSEARGVKRTEGFIQNVNQNATTGFIESVVLECGDTIHGDFFIDCSGFRGLLIEQTLKVGFEDWSHWLPVNKAIAVPCESFGELLPFTRSTAQEYGWQWRIPLQHRTGNGYVYCDKFVDDESATTALMSRLDGKAMAEPRQLRFTAGMRKKCWEKNCVAIGLSSGFLEPLESTSIHLIQMGISKLLGKFPRDDMSSLLIDSYNKEMRNDYDNVKDFLIAHYKITEREDTEFWRYVKNMPIPDSLKERLEIFRMRGEVMVKQTELFKEASWFAVLMGQGWDAQGYHPLADAISDDELRIRLTKVRSGIQTRLAGMSSHADFIRANCRSIASKL